MKNLKITVIFLLSILLGLTGSVQAFWFNFSSGDDYDYPYWGPAYSHWGTYIPQQLPSYYRSEMVRNRQQSMNRNNDAMERLAGMLYRRYDFDREEAVQLARKIEMTSGAALARDFHPGAVRSFGSHTTPLFWGNEQTFKANTEALKSAAADLAAELEKKPAAKEKAIVMPNRFRNNLEEGDQVRLSPAVWEKFNNLSRTCNSCHRSFRGPGW